MHASPWNAGSISGSALGELKWSNTMASSSKGGRSRTTSKFGFDVTKPVKRGFLNKQGKTVQRFRNRFFVLYPGFLVYYDEETKWRRDYTRGDTLEVFFESRARVFMVLCVNIYICSTVRLWVESERCKFVSACLLLFSMFCQSLYLVSCFVLSSEPAWCHQAKGRTMQYPTTTWRV